MSAESQRGAGAWPLTAGAFGRWWRLLAMVQPLASPSSGATAAVEPARADGRRDPRPSAPFRAPSVPLRFGEPA
jgi:hypothetical protein